MKKTPEFNFFAVDQVSLWKVQIRGDSDEELNKLKPRKEDQLLSTREISSYFTEKPLEGYILIIIKPPELPTVPWSDSLESCLYQLYASDNIVNIFWGQNLKEDDTTWRIYVVTRNLLRQSVKTEKIGDQAFDEALDNELGPSFRKMHYNLVGMSTGYKRTQGKFTEVPAITLYVRQKGILRRGCVEFPDEIRGYPTDIVEACVATPYGLGTSGTFSAVIYDKNSRQIEEMCNKIEEDKKKSALACYECGIRGNFFSKIHEKYFGIDAAFCIFSNINRTLCPNKFSISPEDFKKEKLSEDIYLNDFYEFKEFDDVVDIDVFKVEKATGLTFGKLVPVYSAISIDLRNKNIEYAKKQGKIPSYNDDKERLLGILHAAWITENSNYAIASPYFAVFEALDVVTVSSALGFEYADIASSSFGDTLCIFYKQI
ncbi:hypothetical protein RhiirA4_466122 [Rhizophagus irregularis]|uniref:Uncharacterized protein n=1 Tax=Rhizophagus irregularis TaxID=588596 RepID=A0A2I1GTG6_9GLOM|nr:hypothetical protein RhiirA4_466122 [Rhizophagus irregularis]